MKSLIIMALCGLSFWACDGSYTTTLVAPAAPLPAVADMASPVPRCATPAADGTYRDAHLGVSCHFEPLNGVRVCVPDDMPRIIGAVCDPKGGPDRIWLDRNPDCNKGTSLYAIPRPSRVCGNLTGLLQKVAIAVQPDQQIYVYDPQAKTCTPSGFSARSDSPIVDRAPAPDPVFLSEKDLASTVCAP
mgnify:FL=1